MKVDPTRTWAAVEAAYEAETNPRHKLLLKEVRDHMKTEVCGELELLMATLTAEPQYHIWGQGPDRGPKGRAAVRACITTCGPLGPHPLVRPPRPSLPMRALAVGVAVYKNADEIKSAFAYFTDVSSTLSSRVGCEAAGLGLMMTGLQGMQARMGRQAIVTC